MAQQSMFQKEINLRTCKKPFTHVLQKKMMNKKFTDKLCWDISRLVKGVKADEESSRKGKTICPYVLADEDIQASWNDDKEDSNLQDEDRHEDLQDALQPHVPEEDAGQEVCGHQEGVPPPRLPRIQEMPQEGDEEKLEEEDRSHAAGHAAGPLPRDYSLPQRTTTDKGSQGRPKRKKNPLNKF